MSGFKNMGVDDDDADDWQSMPVEHKSTATPHFDTYTNPNDLLYGDEDQQDWSDPDDPRRFQSLPSRSKPKTRKKLFSRSKTASEHTPRPQPPPPPPPSAPNASGTKHGQTATNATGRHLDIDDARGYDWRAKPTTADEDDDQSDGEKGYTQLRLDEDEEGEELHAATEYLFQDGARHDPYGEHTTATPLNQMNTTKQLLSEGQKIAYVGLCSLLASEMVRAVRRVPGKGLDSAKESIHSWKLKVIARLYQHMDIEPSEQKMIESLAEHGVLPTDLAPSLITTQTIDNPDFDPDALRERQEEEQEEELKQQQAESERAERASTPTPSSPLPPSQSKDSLHIPRGTNPFGDDQDQPHTTLAQTSTPRPASDDQDDGDIGMQADDDRGASDTPQTKVIADPNTASQLANASTAVDTGDPLASIEVSATLGLTKEPQPVEPPPGALDGVTTSISSADATITLDLRWTVLCDLFLVLTADSVYDARSRVLLENIASHLGLTWMDVTKFEKRVTDALEIEEGIDSLSDKSAVQKRMLMARKKRMLMMGLATVGGGLVIGLSAGLLAPVIGAGVGAALGAVGVGGTSTFLGGIGGAALITSTGTLGGMGLGGHGMSRRTRSVKTFEFRPIHNNKRVNAIVTVPGFMNGPLDDVRLPFSVIDSIMGDAFSVLWEPDMMQEMGNALGIMWNETIVQGVQQVLAATVAGAGAMFAALAWPLWLTKLGYLIDNPWSNALDRASAAGLILADTLVKRQLGVRPITLVGYSLGARVIFYALLELHRIKAYGIVQNVYIMGAPITAKDETWKEARSVVSGRFVSAFSRTDWILGYLHRAASGGLRSIAGLHPVERVQDVENVDVTHVVPGHLGYRPLMPLVLGELGFRTTADYFDEPEDLNAIPERQVVRQDDAQLELKTVKTKTGGFGKIWRKKSSASTSGATTPTLAVSSSNPAPKTALYDEYEDDDLPPRESDVPAVTAPVAPPPAQPVVTQPRKVSGVDEVKMQEAAGQRRPATPEIDRPPSTSAHVDTEAILRELRESGIQVRELESSLPPLVTSSMPSSATAPTFGMVPTNDRTSQSETADPGFGGVPPLTGISLTFASYDDDDDEDAPQVSMDSKSSDFDNDQSASANASAWGGSIVSQDDAEDESWATGSSSARVARPGISHTVSAGGRERAASLVLSPAIDEAPGTPFSVQQHDSVRTAYFDSTGVATPPSARQGDSTPLSAPPTSLDPWASENPW